MPLPPRVSRKDSQQQTRERLRHSAAASIARHGVAASRIEAITEAAGYSRGAFYSNYASKLDLLIDLLKEKQIGEVKLWQDVISHTADVEADLAVLSARYDNLPDVQARARLNVELQLEADRNPEFRPVFLEYLDGLYAEMRRLFVMMLERRGKAAPDNLDAILVTTRLLGLGLGSSSLLGADIGGRTTPSKVMFEFLHGIMQSAPDLQPRAKQMTAANAP